MAECVFGEDENIQCSVYYKSQVRKRETTTRATRELETDAIIVIKEEGKSYADLLKTVKEGMKTTPAETIDGIQQIRQMRDGNMLITIKRDQRGAVQMKEALTKMVGGTTNVRVRAAGRRRGGVSLHVMRLLDYTTCSTQPARSELV